MSDLTGRLRLVLDTNVWLDWLVFDDPTMAPIRAAVAAGRAEVFIDDTCAAELARVLGRKLGRRTLNSAAQAAALAEVSRVARPITASSHDAVELPKCRDSDDQKFLEAAAAAHADVLITKDAALLELARRRTRPPPFRIVTPHAFAATAP